MLGGDTAPFTRHECKQGTWGQVLLVNGVNYLCEPCAARHQIHCDQCGRPDDVITRHFSDGAWGCDGCAGDIQPVPGDRKARLPIYVGR
jgi:hypothetical protein